VGLRRREALTAALLAGFMGVLPGCSRPAIRGRAVPRGAPVLALGDSLTAGTGADASQAYPSELARLTGWTVVNAGVPGDTSAQALARLPALLAEIRPALVILGIGGNDLLRRLPEPDLRENIRRMVSLCTTGEVQVLLLAVPRPTLASRLTDSLDDHPLYGELSEALKVPLHRRGWSEVLADPALRSDEIHANATGYRQFAQGLMATLRAVGLLA
jgi:acyl-CoA hydrolase